MSDIDWTRLADKINPKPDGQDVLRLRVGTVVSFNAGNTINVTLDDVLLDKPVPVLAGAPVAVGRPVQLLSYRGSLLAIGEVDTGASGGSGRPLCVAVQTVTQNIPDSTDVALTFSGADTVDTHGMHDPSTFNTRFTAKVPGWYELVGSVYMTAVTTFNNREAWFRKNGNTVLPFGRRMGNAANAVNFSMEVTSPVAMNGTTDYIELMVSQDNSGNTTLSTAISSPFASAVSMKYLRPL